MNKKFSTLMASLMLASAFSVSAQTGNPTPSQTDKYEDGKYYLLGSYDKGFLAVNSDPQSSYYGALSLIDPVNTPSISKPWNLNDTRSALWKVTVTEGKAGDAPKYSFVNVATGMTLSVPTPEEVGQTVGATISGGYMEWLDGGANSYTTDNTDAKADFYSYVDSKEIVYFVVENNELKVEKNEYSKTDFDRVLNIQPYLAVTIDLTADDLNKELIANNDKGTSFKLSFDQDVTEGAENLFAGVDLVATQLYKDGAGWTTEAMDGKTPRSSYGYVLLNVKDTKNYLMVDTALHTGSEAEKQLPKFTYVSDPDAKGDPIEGNNYSRLAESSHFKFAYEPTNDRVLIKVEKYAKRVANEDGTPVLVKGVDGNAAYTYWPTDRYALKGAEGLFDPPQF